MSDPSPTPDNQAIFERLRSELQKKRPSRKRRAIEKFFLAALGSIPWVGGFLSAAAAFKVEETSIKSNSLQTEWLEEHQEKLEALQETLAEIQRRFEAFGAAGEERIHLSEKTKPPLFSVSSPARAPMRQLHGATHTSWARMERGLGLCGV